MNRAIRWRPWQFTLRSVLLLTTVIALLLGWWVKEIERERRAVAAIQELGGKIEFEPRGPRWLRQLGWGELCQKVVAVNLPGTRAVEAVPLLARFSSFKKVDLEYYGPRYEIEDINRNGPDLKCMVVQRWSPADADLRRQLPGVEVELREWSFGCYSLPLAVRARCRQCHVGQKESAHRQPPSNPR